jgi:hypothetical protein
MIGKHTLGVLVALLVASFAGCQSASESDTGEITLTAPANEAHVALLAEAVARLAESKAGFYINKGAGDPARARVAKFVVQEKARTVSLDLTEFAAELGGAATTKVLAQLLTFPLPEAVKTASFSLDDASQALGFAEVLAGIFNKDRDDEKSIELEGATFVDLVEQCKQQGFSAEAKVYEPNPAGGDTLIPFDCRKVTRQKRSGLTLTQIEGAALSTYMSEFYSTANQLVRQRRFAFPSDLPKVGTTTNKVAVEAFVSLLIISALNKLDPGPEHAYRGVGAVRKLCTKDAAALPGPAPVDPKSAADQFCKYYGNVKSFSECSFESASRAPNIALMFSGVLEDTLADDEVGDNGPEYRDAALPAKGALNLVLEMRGNSGQFIAPLSPLVHEMEVLFKPGTPFKVSAASVALRPKAPPAGATFSSYETFETIPCSAWGKATSEQIKRISHVRMAMEESL